MKKFSSILASFLLLVLFFSGCKNFLNGGSFLEELDQSIVDAAAPAVDIYIEADANSGTASPSGKVSFKMGRTFSVIFTESKEYQFLGWEVIDRTTKESIENAIEILDTKDNETKFKILANRSNIQLHPICAERLTVTFSPNNSDNGVPRDSSINLTFNKNVSSENDFSKIQITCDGNDITQYYKEPVLNESILTFAADLENLIPVSGMKTVKVTVPQDLYYLQNEQKVTLGSDKSYSFKINNSTDNKAEITFNVASNSGSITPSGTNKYNIGDEVKIKFEPKTGISFKGWSILDGDGNVIKEDIIKVQDINAVETTLTIMKDVKGISITPKNVLIPTYIALLPVDSSTGNVSSQDTDIVIKFNTPIELSDFYDKTNDTFVNIVISSNNTNLISGSTATDRFKYYERPKISADKKTLTIATNKNNLQMPRAEKGQPATMKKDVTVTLKTTNVYAKEVKMNFTSDISWTYTIDNTVDSLDPQIESIKVYKDPQLKQELSSSVFTDDWTIDDIKRNYVSKIYVKIKGYDKDSGVKSLRVIERLWRDTNAIDKTATSEDSKPSYFTTDINNEAITILGDGFYEAIIPVTFSNTPDGIVQIRFALSDYADNASKEVTYYVLKDTTLEQLDICPPEERHSPGEYIYSNINDNLKNTKIVKFRRIDNDFIRECDGNNDFVKIKIETLKEKNKPYIGLDSEIIIQKVLWGYKNDESVMSEVYYDKDLSCYCFTRNRYQTTYIKYYAIDAAGNIQTLLRVIPKTPVITGIEEKTPYIQLKFTKTSPETTKEINTNDFGYYTLFKNESISDSYLIPFGEAVYDYGDNTYNNRRKGFQDYTGLNPFTYNPCEKGDGQNIYKIPAGCNSDDFKDFRPEGNYYVYFIPFAKYNERTYFGAISEPVVLNVKYDTELNRNICNLAETSEEPKSSDLPKDFEIISEEGAKNSGIYKITVNYPETFVKNESLSYYIKVRWGLKSGYTQNTYRYGSNTFELPTQSTTASYKYYVTIVARSSNGKELESTQKELVCTRDNIPPTMKEQNDHFSTLNGHKLLKTYASNPKYCYPLDVNVTSLKDDYSNLGMYRNTNNKMEIKYCLIPFEANQDSPTAFTIDDLLNKEKMTVEYDYDQDMLFLPYKNYIAPGLYTMCMEYEDLNSNTGITYYKVSTLGPYGEDKMVISYIKDGENDAVKSEISNSTTGADRHFIEYISNNNGVFSWIPIYEKDAQGKTKGYSYARGEGGQAKSSSFNLKFADIGDGNFFIKAYGNYYNKVDPNLHHFPTQYILPEYLKNPSNYSCKIKSYVNTDSGNHEMIIFSDVGSPTLVRTVYSNINLNNISTMDKDEQIWSIYGIEVTTSLKQDTGSFNYSVPVDSSEIPSGYWYTTLIHHANGDIIMTPPKQK